MASTFYPLIVSDIRKETPRCVSIAFEVPNEYKDAFSFKPGQYVVVKKEKGGETLRRSYSICAGPHEDELRIAVKHVQQGRFSTYANQELQVGDVLEVMPPSGRFTTSIHPKNNRRILFIAAGSGITPIISLIKTVLHQEPASEAVLVYGNRSRGEVIFRDELADLKNHYVNRFSVFHVFSQESLETPLLEGRIEEKKLDVLLEQVMGANPDEVFICGPQVMMMTLRNFLLGRKMESEKIHIELFGTPVEKDKRERTPDQEAVACAVTLRIDGSTVQFDMENNTDSILDAALKRGADLPFACKGGVCTTCRAKVVEGEVEMEVNYGLEPSEVAAGFILTCQSHPLTNTLTVDYDFR